jgi:hypothetical protein
MSKSPDPRKFDVRLINRNIKSKMITVKDIQDHLKSLPDVANKAITLGEVEDERVARQKAEAPEADRPDEA